MFDSLVELDVILRNKSDGFARFARTSCATDAMDVCLGVRGNVVINDDVNVRNVETA